MRDKKIDQKIGKKKAFDIIKREGIFTTSFEIVETDTGKRVGHDGSREKATAKAEELARKN